MSRNRPTTATLPCVTPDCTGLRGPKSKTGLCRRCQFARVEEKRLAGLRAYAISARGKANVKRAAIIRHTRSVEWCPPEYLPQYRELTRRNRFSRVKCADAKRMILEQIAVDQRRLAEARRHETFEEKLARIVASGELKVVANLNRHHLTPTIREAA